MTETDDATVPVARDLSAIERLTVMLEEQVAYERPGGTATVMAAPVANLEAWQNLVDAYERRHGHAPPHILDEDDDLAWQPPLQTLLFWSEDYRRIHGREMDRRPTIATEVGFLRRVLPWILDNEPHYDDFADDVHKARRRLEDELAEGVRPEYGVPCLGFDCHGALLRRMTLDDGTQTDWWCRVCRETYDDEAYLRHARAAGELVHVEDVDGETWCTIAWASQVVERSPAVIRKWIQRGRVRRACMLTGRRRGFVSLEDCRRASDSARRAA